MTDDEVNTSLAANTMKALLTNHFQRTIPVTPSTDKHYSLPPGTSKVVIHKKNNSCTPCVPMFFKMAAMLQIPGVFPRVSRLGSAKAVQCPRPGPTIGDKSQ